MKNLISFVWEILKIVIIALAIVVPIRYFIFQPFIVSGNSMEPNFQSGNYLIIDEISYRFSQPQRGEVIIFKYPQDPSKRFIKRIIGLPGETVEIQNNQIIISKNGEEFVLDESGYLPEYLKNLDNEQISLSKNQYFVLGDNRPHSYDSEEWGFLPEENIIGRAFFRAWPFAALTKFAVPTY